MATTMASLARFLTPTDAQGARASRFHAVLSAKERKTNVAVLAAAVVAFAAGSSLLLLSSGSAGFAVGRHLLAKKVPAKRVALLRPFGPHDGPDLLHSFDLWDTHWPCGSSSSSSSSSGSPRHDYAVDLVISYSRTLGGASTTEEEELARETVEGIKSKFERAGHGVGGWSGCLSSVRVIEAGIDPERDGYDRENGEPSDVDWVYGPNEQFRRSLEQIMGMGPPPSSDEHEQSGNEEGAEDSRPSNDVYYEVAVIMEPDTQPRRAGWLDELLDDVAGKGPFAILGSKYKGHSWDKIRGVLPRSLLEHINGNAAFNLTHPLMKSILDELKLEKDASYFRAIPYDYRISQMIEEGRSGTSPEFPFPRIKDAVSGERVILPRNEGKFRSWWERWGEEEPIKESNAIANFADTNYLPEHLGEEALVHGQHVFQPWDPKSHKITLVVSDWREKLSKDLLSSLEKSDQPFSEVIIISDRDGNDHPSNFVEQVLKRLFGWTANRHSLSIPVRVVERSTYDILDVCDAPVSTDWFFHTNAYHSVSSHTDLMFTDEKPVPRPVVPYTPGDSTHCDAYDACRETFRLARAIYPDLDKVVLDMHVPYHTPSRDAFCEYWREENGRYGEKLARFEGGRGATLARSVPLGPTAAGYVAYLYRQGMADNLYAFANVLLHGQRDAFVKIHTEREAESRRLQKEALEQELTSLRAAVDVDQKDDKRPERRKLPKGGNGGGGNGGGGDCTPEGGRTTFCEAGGQNTLECCTGLVCSENGKCVTAPYGGGRRAQRLALTAPGMLVAEG